MKTLIIYYSRSGTTRKLADYLAEKLSADVSEIQCPRYRWPYLGFMRAGRHSLSGKLPAVTMPKSTAGYDLVLLGTPIWTSFPSVAMRSYLAAKPDLPENVGVFFTSGGAKANENAPEMMNELLGRNTYPQLWLTQEQVETAPLNGLTEGFLAQLQTSRQAASG